MDYVVVMAELPKPPLRPAKKDEGLTRLFMVTFGVQIDSQGKSFPAGSIQPLALTFRTFLFLLLVIEIVELNRHDFLKTGARNFLT